MRGPVGFRVLRHDSMGIFASSPPGEVTPHSARKLQKMPASGISSELRAHQMAPRMSEVPGRPRTKNPRRSRNSGLCRISRFRSSPPPVLSRRLFGVCKRHLVSYFSFWYWVLVLWYAFDGVRGIGVVTTFAAVNFPYFFFFVFIKSSSPALRAQTRPAMEFGSGEEGLRPDLLSPFSYFFVVASRGARRLLMVSALPLCPLLFGRGVRGHRRPFFKAPGPYCGAEGRWRTLALTALSLCLTTAVLPVCSLCLLMFFSFPQCRLIIDPAGSVGPSGTGCDSDWKLVLGSAWLQPGPDTQLGGTPSVWSCLFPRVRRLLRSSPLFLLSSPL